MRHSILAILILGFIHCKAQAAENWFPVEKEGAKTVYTDKSKCESLEGQDCFDITGKDPLRWKAGFKAPKVPQTVDCLDAADCQAKIDEGEVCANANFDDKANWPAMDFAAADRPADGFFLWCPKRGLVPDPAGAAQADAKLQEAQEKRQKIDQLKNSIDGCRSTLQGAPSDAQLRQCVQSLVKWILRGQLSSSEL